MIEIGQAVYFIEIKKVGNIIYYRYFSKKEPYKMVQL